MRSLEGLAPPADRSTVRLRLRSERGFGLVELLMAMVMLNVGILALVVAFDSGMFALKRAGRIETATSLADAQMELYRALPYTSIALDASTIPGSAPYTTDTAYSATQVTTTCTGSPLPNECRATRTVSNSTSPASPDHKSYRVDTYIVLSTATTTPPTPSNGRPVKIVTVVVRDGYKLSAKPLVREVSTFDASTG
jgi:type II secretory pathway pseudopilin PulG